MTTQFNVVMIGESGVGKTQFIRYHTGEDFEFTYKPTQDVTIHHTMFPTNHGNYIVHLYDTPADLKITDGYEIQSHGSIHGVIALFDITSRLSFQNLPSRIQEIKKCEPDADVMVCGNKLDLGHYSRFKKIVNPMPFCPISVCHGKDCDEPVVRLIRKWTGYSDLKIDYASVIEDYYNNQDETLEYDYF